MKCSVSWHGRDRQQ